MNKIDWVKGDLLSIDIPAHGEALLHAGETFLTKAFHLSGALDKDNRVLSITRFSEISGGSTGRKFLLSVNYSKHHPHLHNHLFVKFSRDFDSPTRDASRTQMELEVQFALLSRDPCFPIEVPACYFSDYHRESGTGILVTQCIPYGMSGVEEHYPKGLDYQMPHQLEHYQALIKSLARLAGSHKSGGLPEAVEQYFPFDPAKLNVSARQPFTPEQISEKVSAYATFSRAFPQLLPANIRSETFLEMLADEAPRFQALQEKTNPILQSKTEMIALCHWNAHVDNAWFWRDDSGQMTCGLLDWGNVSQMNVAMAIWGCLSAAELFIWDDHLNDLLELFRSEFEENGGVVDPQDLKLHLVLYVAKMGLTWMLDMPLITLSKIPGLAEIENRFDSRIENNERARTQILIMTAFLNLWEKSDMNNVIRYMERIER